MTKMKDRLHTGELYLPGDEEIMANQTKRLDRLYDFKEYYFKDRKIDYNSIK